MKIQPELVNRIDYQCELLAQKIKKLRQTHDVKLGTTSAPRPADYVHDPLIGETCSEWCELIEPENSALDRILLETLAGAPETDPAKQAKLDRSNLWLWGGPTPYWGGSMADDTLIRNAEYFDIHNGVYVYGPTNDKMLGLHSCFDNLLCQVNSNCRSPGAQEGSSNVENAERLSELSLKYPNIRGAMLDDVATGFFKTILPDEFAAVNQALKKHNKALKMYGVVYAHELFSRNFSFMASCFDVINLWFWNKEEILSYDETVQKCLEVFPGKPILQGIFLHDYGMSDAGAPPELLIYQLDRAREYIAKGQIEGVVILGDREIAKWPATAAAVQKYLQNQ